MPRFSKPMVDKVIGAFMDGKSIAFIAVRYAIEEEDVEDIIRQKLNDEKEGGRKD